MMSQIEEECETLSAQAQEASLSAPTSIWVFESLSKCLPKRMFPDSQSTLFQLADYQLLQSLHVYVETQALQTKVLGRTKETAVTTNNRHQ